MAHEDLDTTCYFCLQECDTHFRPCACPRLCHKACLARWCLQQAGRSEEKNCRFCSRELPDWRENIQQPKNFKDVVPKMGIEYQGRYYFVDVEPGDTGREKFIAKVKELFKLSPKQPFDVKFECMMPSSVERIDLKGMSAYDAAVYCAALKAAERASQVGNL